MNLSLVTKSQIWLATTSTTNQLYLWVITQSVSLHTGLKRLMAFVLILHFLNPAITSYHKPSIKARTQIARLVSSAIQIFKIKQILGLFISETKQRYLRNWNFDNCGNSGVNFWHRRTLKDWEYYQLMKTSN